MYYKTKIHVNQHNIRANHKHKDTEDYIVVPEFTCKTRGKTYTGHNVEIHGVVTSKSVSCNRIKPLSCGAKVWLETTGAVYVDGILINGR